MKVYITKYALTSGIDEVECSQFNMNSGTIHYKLPGSHFTQYAHGKDWRGTMAEAEIRAEEMRVKKIASLKKSIAKLEKLNFTEVTE